jgi:rhodanese-related sulfurtransferase
VQQFLIDNALLIAMALSSGVMLAWPALQRRSGAQVGTAQAVQLINREKAVLVDVGEPNEFAALHANVARNIPFGQLETTKDLPSNKALPVVLVCPSGARAGRAVAILKKLGYERACAVAGGTKAWADANLPVQRKVAA